jgi:hypothetical protein
MASSFTQQDDAMKDPQTEMIERTVNCQCSLPLPLLHLASYYGVVFAILPILKAGADVFHTIRTPGYEFTGKN